MPGRILRKYIPGVHQRAMQLISWYNQLLQSNAPFIVDNLGGSFKSYLAVHSSRRVVERLKAGMDRESCDTVDVVVERMLTYPDASDRNHQKISGPLVGGLLPAETPSRQQKVSQFLRATQQKIHLVPKKFDESVFFYHHGLKELPASVVRYIEGADFIDCGAYIGDSALVLHEYGPRKIYSIDMSKKSIERYRKNMAYNGIAEAQYEIIELGIGDRDDLEPISLPDTGSAGFSVFRKTSKYDFIEIQRKSLDGIVAQYDIEPRFIKADIEGAAMDLVAGGVSTIQKYRPVFSLAVYHNPREFFEIKPFLEDLLDDYTFLIRKLESSTYRNLCHSEVILIAYPDEAVSG